MEFAFSPDDIELNFSQGNLRLLNALLGFIMFGIALDLKLTDFKRLLTEPKPAFVGISSQLLLLPAVTFLLIYMVRPYPSIALGMILVAACPGGNISNFICHLSKGNVALSVTLTSITTLLAVVMTPFNFNLWGGILPETSAILQTVTLSFWDMVRTITLIIIIPIIIGVTFAYYLPAIADRIKRPIKIVSLLIFGAFIVFALKANYDVFLQSIQYIVFLVVIHNAVAFLAGYGWARITGLLGRDTKAVTIETGIQNSGLALILIFNFFGGMGGMALIAACWGVWHIIAGLVLAAVWGRFIQPNAVSS